MFEAIDHFDKTVTTWLNGIDFPDVLDWFFKVITWLGEFGFIWILLGVLFLITFKDKKPAIGMLLALAMCFLLNDLVFKQIFERVRPYDALDDIKLIIGKQHSFSFPSGHAANGMAAAFGFFCLTKSNWRWVLVTLAVLIGISRIYLKMHYCSDVAVGLLLGMAVGFVASLLVRGWYARGGRKRRARR